MTLIDRVLSAVLRPRCAACRTARVARPDTCCSDACWSVWHAREIG